MSVSRRDLAALYAKGDDPWNFRDSAYEHGKFAATAAALPRPRYAHGLEIGCGNGELARHLAPRCARYTGIDAIPAALAAARRAVPEGRFVETFLPAPLPEAGNAPYDLIVLSEILYFLDRGGIADLAARIDAAAPAGDVICVTWRGPSGNPLAGEDALAAYMAASSGRASKCLRRAPLYRIDLLTPLPAGAAP